VLPSKRAILSGASQAIISPLWLAGVLTGAKSFEANPIIGNRRLNALGLHAARVNAAYHLAKARRERLEPLVSAEDRGAFERDGFVVRSNFLPAGDFAALLAQVKACRRGAREITQGSTKNRKIAVNPETLAAIPALRTVLHSTEWRGLVRFVGSRDADPVVFLQSILRRDGDGPEDPQTELHADTFHPTVKAWLFLTDVAADAGPFTYVSGSHRLTAERLQWEQQMSLGARWSPDQATREGSFRISAIDLPKLGLPQPRAFAVPANTLVVADTFGFHARGPSIGPSLRVEIFALGRRSPFLPWTGLDPWSTAGLGRRTSLRWKFGDFIEAAGLKRNAWRSRAGVSAFDVP